MNAMPASAADSATDWFDTSRKLTHFQRAVGAGVRRAREDARLTQDDIAREARIFGLSWDRAKVAALERGDKAVSAEELILLLGVFYVLGTNVDMSRLLGDVESAVIFAGGAILAPETIANLLAGHPLKLAALQPPTEWTSASRPKKRTAKGSWRGPENEDAAIRRACQLGLNKVPYHEWLSAQAHAGEAEEKAARKLGESVPVILAAAVDLWGRSLTAEREARVEATPDYEAARAEVIADQAGEAAVRAHIEAGRARALASSGDAESPHATREVRQATARAKAAADAAMAAQQVAHDARQRVDARRMQAIRGHVTRQLLEELAIRLDEGWRPHALSHLVTFKAGDRVEHHHYGQGDVYAVMDDVDITVLVIFDSDRRIEEASDQIAFSAKNSRTLRRIDAIES